MHERILDAEHALHCTGCGPGYERESKKPATIKIRRILYEAMIEQQCDHK